MQYMDIFYSFLDAKLPCIKNISQNVSMGESESKQHTLEIPWFLSLIYFQMGLPNKIGTY